MLRSYIYEYNTTGSDVNIIDPVQRAARDHRPAREILSLDDYRTRYNQYSERLHQILHDASTTNGQLVYTTYICTQHTIHVRSLLTERGRALIHRHRCRFRCGHQGHARLRAAHPCVGRP